VDELRAHPGFDGIEILESLHRYWHVKDLSVRPEHRMVAHTGFLVIARRVPEEVAIPPAPREPKVADLQPLAAGESERLDEEPTEEES
jgi:tRNA (adenine57-N1/adenine58-N1)-methyltransferase